LLSSLIQRARHGDPLALHDLLDAVTPSVRGWCGPIALDDAPDAVQETLIVVLNHLADVRDPAAFVGWLRTVAVREAVRIANRAARFIPSELPDLPAPGDPSLVADVDDVLRRLSPEHRAILMLRDRDGFTEEEASATLGIPIGTVRSRLFRARRAFGSAWLGRPAGSEARASRDAHARDAHASRDAQASRKAHRSPDSPGDHQ
jgi:RNA polymerase sigma-70 factor (ECF subfamily)